MSDLTDEQLEYFSGPVCNMLPGHVEALISEVRRHRAAKRADAKRIKAVVSQAVADVLALNAASTATLAEIHVAGVVLGKAVAMRVAEQLASAAPVLSAEDLHHLRIVRAAIGGQLASSGGHVRWNGELASIAALDRLVGGGK